MAESPSGEAEPLSLRGLHGHDLAERVAGGHDADPRDDRVEHDQVRTVGAKLDGTGEEADVENFPETGKGIGVEPIE